MGSKNGRGGDSERRFGAPGNDGNGRNAGHARVYKWKVWEWRKLGYDIVGEAVAIGRNGVW